MPSDYQFVSTAAAALVSGMIAAYEKITGVSVRPASPEQLFISWVADVIVQTRAQINYAANQNLPSRASGEKLDALGELFYGGERPEAQAAGCTVRFTLSEARPSSVLIPAGTRVTDSSGVLYWATVADAYVAIGGTEAELPVLCLTPGAVGNGYAAGQLNVLVDLFPYCGPCENVTVSDGGADRASDAAYYALLRASEDAYSTAGPVGAYIYWAKSVSADISDVVALMPKVPGTGALLAGHVHIFALMKDGTIASETVKEQILAACSDAEVRPLTDFVSVEDPGVVEYNIAFTYYIQSDASLPAADIQRAVEAAVAGFVRWQSGKLGRDINPSVLISLLMETGIKRVALSEPAFTVLSDGRDNIAPDAARVAEVTITNGGYEDE
jgi:phage-related baseplate assembly protein